MGKKTKIAMVLTLGSILGLVASWFLSPSVRVSGYLALMDAGPLPAQNWALKRLKGLRGEGAEALGYFAQDYYSKDPESLDKKDLELLDEVWEHLWLLGEEAAPAIPSLILALKAQSRITRLGAVMVLRDMGPIAAPAIPALIQALKDKEDLIRVTSAETLGEMGPLAKPAIPALIEALMAEKDEVHRARVARSAFREALRKIGEAP